MNTQKLKMLSPKGNFAGGISQIYAQDSDMSEDIDEEELSFTSAAALVCSESRVIPTQTDGNSNYLLLKNEANGNLVSRAQNI